MSRRGRKEGSVFKRKSDQRWEARIDLGWLDGRRRRRSVYGATRAEAVEKMRAVHRDLANGLTPAPERLTVAAHMTSWLRSAKPPTLRPSSYASYEAITELHIVPSIGRIALAKLTVQDVRDLLRRADEKGLSPRRCQMIRATLRRALNMAMVDNLVMRNVAKLAPSPKQDPRRVDPLTEDDMRSLLESIHGHRLEAAFVVALTTGLRSGELRALTWEDVDLEARTISVRYSMQRIDGDWKRVAPKTKAGSRSIPLPEVTVTALRAHRAAQNRSSLLAGRDWDRRWPLVFTTDTGKPLDGSSLTHSYQAAVRAAGLRHQRLHDARHGAATLWLANHVPLADVAKQLGHTSIAFTLSTYAHALPDLPRDSADRMDEALSR